MVVAVVVLAVVYVLTAVFGVALWLGLRQHNRLIAGLRQDVEHTASAIHARITAHDEKRTILRNEDAQRIVQAHNTAAVAQDRLLYYTKHSAILQRIGAKYDKAIAAIRAKAEADAAPAVAPEPESEDVAPEGMAQVAGSIGLPCG